MRNAASDEEYVSTYIFFWTLQKGGCLVFLASDIAQLFILEPIMSNDLPFIN